MKNRKHVLVVDDVPTNLRYIGEVLKDEYTVSLAKSGNQALKLMEKITPDVILLDVKMPEMDGYETLSCIKAKEGYSDIPVIFLTADTESTSETKGLQMGAFDYIKKPFVPEFILSRIKCALNEE